MPRAENQESNLTPSVEKELPGDATEMQLSGVLYLLTQTCKTQAVV